MENQLTKSEADQGLRHFLFWNKNFWFLVYVIITLLRVPTIIVYLFFIFLLVGSAGNNINWSLWFSIFVFSSIGFLIIIGLRRILFNLIFKYQLVCYDYSDFRIWVIYLSDQKKYVFEQDVNDFGLGIKQQCSRIKVLWLSLMFGDVNVKNQFWFSYRLNLKVNRETLIAMHRGQLTFQTDKQNIIETIELWCINNLVGKQGFELKYYESLIQEKIIEVLGTNYSLLSFTRDFLCKYE